MARPSKNKMSLTQLDAKIAKLKGERGTWESHWQELMDYINPNKNNVISQRTSGAKRNFQLLDNVGVHSNELMAGALHGLLTNPNSPWFEMTTGSMALDNDDEVRPWLQLVTRDMHMILNNSNFQTEVHEMYLDLPSLGTANMQMEEDDDDVVRFTTKFITDYWIEENSKGEVDQIFREWKWNARQLIEEFGDDSLPKEIMDAYRKNPDEQFIVRAAVYPKIVVDPKASPFGNYVSQYWLPELKFEIETGNYKTFPNLVPRWGKAAGEKYGRSPGMNALPELKVLNKMNETMLIGAQKMVDPPLQMEDDGVVLPLITRPGGINFRRPGSAEIRPIFNNTNIEFGYQAMADRRTRVRDAYFVDKLQLQQSGPQMTATEVLQRTEDSMRLLGPFLGRMQNEFLRPLIDRLFDIMERRNMLPPYPQALSGKKILVRYSSLIAKSQRVAEGQAVMRTFQGAAPFIQLDPSVADNFNGDAAVRILAGIYGNPHEILRSNAEVAKIRKAKADAAAAQAQAQQEAMQAQGAQALASAATGQKA